MEKEETTYYPTISHIKRQFVQLFHTGVKFSCISEKVHKADTLVDKTFLYQSVLLVNLNKDIPNYVFTFDLLYDAFRKALNDTIIKLELDSTIVDFKFTISHTYYMIVKDNNKNQFSYFMGHGNTKNPYIHDNVYYMEGIHSLKEYIQHNLEMNHLEESIMYFHDQFPHSDVTINQVTHIAFLIQPFDMSSGIQRKLFYIANYDDLLDNV